jgi:hypothetical protein
MPVAETFPRAVEYVVVPIPPDDGEMPTPVGVISMTLTDLEGGITLLGLPADAPLEAAVNMVKTLEEAARAGGKPRRFVVIFGAPTCVAWRLIRKDVYDADFGEAGPRRT